MTFKGAGGLVTYEEQARQLTAAAGLNPHTEIPMDTGAIPASWIRTQSEVTALRRFLGQIG